MKNSNMKATVLRGILASSLFILSIATILGFYYVGGLLAEYANKIKVNSPTLASNDTALKLTANLKAFNTQNKTLAEKAELFTIPEQEAQNKIMADIKKYAADAGITVTNFSFNPSASTGAPSTTSYSTKLVTITLASPVNFEKMIKFLSLVENSVPKMQATGINLSAGNNTEIKVDPITLKYYVK